MTILKCSSGSASWLGLWALFFGYLDSNTVSFLSLVLLQLFCLHVKLTMSSLIDSEINSNGFWVSSDSLTPASWVAGTIGRHYHAQLIFVFLVGTGFHHVSQADLELLTSSELPTSASQMLGLQAWATASGQNTCVLMMKVEWTGNNYLELSFGFI